MAAVRAGVDVEGVFAFPGHAYAPDARERAAREEAHALTVAAASLRAVGVEPLVISVSRCPASSARSGARLAGDRAAAGVALGDA